MNRGPALLHFVPYQWRLFKRGVLGRGAWRGGDAIVVTLLALIKLPQYAGACLRLAGKIHEAPSGEDWPAAEALLAIVLASWIFLPVVTRAIDPRGPGLSPARLRRFPLSLPRLLFTSFTAAVVQPVYWLLLVATAFSLLPLAAGGHAAAGVTAGVLYAIACAALAWAVWLAVAALIAGGLKWLLPASAAAGLAGVFAIPKVVWLIRHAGEPEMTAYLDRLTGWLPGSFAVRAAAEGGLAGPATALLAITAAALGASLLFLRVTLDHPGPQGSRARRRGLTFLPAFRSGASSPRAALVAKELAYLSKTSDFWIGLLAGLAAAIYVLMIRERGTWLVMAGVLAVGLNQLAGALNSFGLDARAVDRYRLFPLSGAEILAAKNRAWLIVAAGQMLPILAAAAVKLGPGDTLAIVAAIGASLFLTAAWGNILSIRRPSPRPFFSLESTDQSGGFIGALVTLMIWTVPLGIALFSGAAGLKLTLSINFGLAIMSWYLYRRLLPWSGRVFASRAHEMRGMLTE